MVVELLVENGYDTYSNSVRRSPRRPSDRRQSVSTKVNSTFSTLFEMVSLKCIEKLSQSSNLESPVRALLELEGRLGFP